MDSQRDLEELMRQLREVLCPLGARETQAGPQGAWSIQQIVEHLVLTYASTTRLVVERLAKGRPTQARPRPWQHLQRVYVVRCGFFPRGISAPAAVVPAPGMPAAAGPALFALVEEELALLGETLDQAVASFGQTSRFASHAALGPLNGSEWRRFHRVHGQHHLRQIRAIASRLS